MAIFLALVLFLFSFGFSGSSVGGSGPARPSRPAGGSGTTFQLAPPRRGVDRCNDGFRSRHHRKPLPLRACPVEPGTSP